MNFHFYQDVLGNAIDEYAREPVLMNVDNEGYPLADTDTINLDKYLDFERPVKK